jgi:hypothetical protein
VRKNLSKYRKDSGADQTAVRDTGSVYIKEARGISRRSRCSLGQCLLAYPLALTRHGKECAHET